MRHPAQPRGNIVPGLEIPAAVRIRIDTIEVQRLGNQMARIDRAADPRAEECRVLACALLVHPGKSWTARMEAGISRDKRGALPTDGDRLDRRHIDLGADPTKGLADGAPPERGILHDFASLRRQQPCMREDAQSMLPAGGVEDTHLYPRRPQVDTGK